VRYHKVEKFSVVHLCDLGDPGCGVPTAQTPGWDDRNQEEDARKGASLHDLFCPLCLKSHHTLAFLFEKIGRQIKSNKTAGTVYSVLQKDNLN